MLHKYMLIILLSLPSLALTAQSGCFDKFYKRGQDLYETGKYTDARYQFYAALECEDKPAENEVKIWIERCYQGDAAKLKEQKEIAEQRAKEARSGLLAARAWRLYETDNTLALNLAIEAYLSKPTPEAAYAISNITGNPLSAFYQKNIAGHKKAVTAIAFSPDGQLIASAGLDSTLRLWDAEGHLYQTFPDQPAYISALAFSADSKQLLTGDGDGSIVLWSANGKKLRSFRPHQERVTGLTFSPNGQYFLSRSFDKTARLWSVEGDTLKSFPHPYYVPACVAFLPGGEEFLIAFADGESRIYNLLGQLTDTGISGKAISQLTVSDSGEILWSDRNGQLYLGMPRSYTNYGRTGQSSGRPIAIGFYTGGGFPMCVSEVSGTVSIFTPDGHLVKRLLLNQDSDPAAAIYEVAFSPDGRLIASGDQQGQLRIWQTDHEEELILRGHMGGINSVAFSPDGKYIATSSWDKTAVLWSARGEALAVIPAPEYSVNTLSFPENDDVRIERSDNGSVTFSAGAKTETKTLQHHFQKVTFSPEGQLITECSDSTSIVWDPAGNRVRTFNTPAPARNTADLLDGLPCNRENIIAAELSPDGRYILTGHRQGIAKLWTRDGDEIQTFEGHRSYIPFSAFAKDGSIDLTEQILGKQPQIRIDGKIPDLSLLETSVTAVAFSPDGKYILTGSTDGTARVWPRWDVLLKTGRIAKMSEEQRQEYGLE